MISRTPTARTIYALVILFAFSTLGSNGTSGGCADIAGPGYGSTGFGTTGPAVYGQPAPAASGASASSAGGQTYFQPTINNYRVDWCLNWGASCGGPAASAFCQRMGYSHATAWTQAPGIGAFSPTLVMGDGTICNQPGCAGFDSITCASAAPAPAPAAAPAQATFFEEPGTNRPGMDYRNFTPKSAEPKHCKNACRKESQCRAFTYVKPGVQGPQPRCWLKSGAPAPQPDACCYSGVKQ